MDKDDLIRSFERLTPSEAQKEKMLHHILSADTKKKPAPKHSFRLKYALSFAAIAACMTAVIVTVNPLEKYREGGRPYSSEMLSGEVSPLSGDERITRGILGPAEGKNAPGEQSGEPRLIPPGEEMTIEAYYDYLGVNVESGLDIPEGYINRTEHVALLDTDVDDTWLFEYQANDGYIYIHTTRHTGNVAVAMSDSAYTPFDTNGAKGGGRKDDRFYKVYLIREDVAYTIDTYNVSEEDLTNLCLSILNESHN